jgi:hypothetical protein
MADTRLQWTLKHKALSREYRTMLEMAAKRQGMGLMDWIVETLQAEARNVLSPDRPPPSPPARAEDLVHELGEQLAARVDRQVDSLRLELRRGRWRKAR